MYVFITDFCYLDRFRLLLYFILSHVSGYVFDFMFFELDYVVYLFGT